MMTVEEMFAQEGIEKKDVVLIAEESDYWESSSYFVTSNWTKYVEELTIGQNKWLGKIFDDMTELKIEKRGPFRP